MNKLSKDFHCNICDKYYKSYQSLWNHNKKFHSLSAKNTLKSANNSSKSSIDSPKSVKNILSCEFCNKTFKRIDYLKKHINLNRCKKKDDIITLLKKENEELKISFQKEIEDLKNQLKEFMNKNCKIHYKTLQKINNQQNNTQNINTQNNINIIGFTKENLLELFSPKEKLNILQKKFNSLSYIIEYTHFNKKYPQMNNIKITNLNNNIAHIYDGIKNKFIATTKDKLISDLIINRMYDIEEFKGEVMEKMTKKEKDIINRMLNKFYEDEEIFIDNKKEEIIHFNEYIFSI
jgi:hypothetical protein